MSPDATPPADPDGTLERTPNGGVLRFERQLPYAVEDVWSAITEPSRLASWWLPFDADIAVELRPGGLMVMTATGDASTTEPMTMTLEILVVDPPRRLEHTHVDPGSRLVWELEPTATGCVLRLSHFLVDPELAVRNNYLVGLHTSLDRLVPCLTGSPVAWDWDAFAAHQRRYAAAGLAAAAES